MDSSNNKPTVDYELLPVGLPPKGDDPKKGGNGGGAGAPTNAKYDPQWAQRASAALMESQGMKVVEVQQTLTELRKTQAAVARSLGETKEAVLWLQKLEVLEQQLTLVPRYREKAQKIVAEMDNITQRVAKAKKRASKLSGEEFPEYHGVVGVGGGMRKGSGGAGSSSR